MIGEIITFYSYKGGTGRSMALACVASLLAQNGKRVLIIDWDFEAPGLHRYFRDYLDDPDLQKTDGLIDMFWDFSARMLTPNESKESLDMDLYTNALGYANPVWLPDMSEQDGSLHFLCSGCQEPGYADRVRNFDWNVFYARLGGKDFIDAFRKRLKSQYDYVLIDSRTGIADTSGICTIQMPDLVVLCFTYNRQSVLGVDSVARSIHSQREDVLLLPVAMRVQKIDGLTDARDFASKYLKNWIPEQYRQNPNDYWETCEVAHHPSYAFLENLSAFFATKGTRDSMRLDMAWLADKIVSSIIQKEYGASYNLREIPIILVDMVDFSKLLVVEEQRSILVRLDEILEATLRPFIGLGNPRDIVGWHGTGDGYYITMEGFPSTVAMRFAIDLEKNLTNEKNKHLDYPLRLRVGLGLGDVEWVGKQQLSRAFTEAVRLVDHPWTRAVLENCTESSIVLVASRGFIDDWHSRCGELRGTLQIPSSPPWVSVEFPIKHGKILAGYIRVEKGLLDKIKAEVPISTSSDTIPVDLTDWLSSLLDRTGTLEIRGIGSGTGRQRESGKYPIEQLYTLLRSQGGLDERGTREEQKTVSLAELLPKHRRLLIEGQPGAGKTTFLKLVAAMLAKDLLRIANPHGESWRQQHLGMEGAVRYPLFLRLSELAMLLADDKNPTADDCRRLLDLLARSPHGSADLRWRSHWEGLLQQGEAMLLLDGLDEVADETVRARVIRIVQDAARNWQNCPIIVTSRPFGVEQMKGLGFHHGVIDPFGPEEIRTFIGRWSAALHASGDGGHDSGVAADHQQILLQAIADRPTIRRLAANPVMLTCLCVVHWNEGKLPEGRARVYQAVIRWLILSRTVMRSAAGYTDPFAEEAFAALALAMMKGGRRGKRVVFDREEGAEAVADLVSQHFQSFVSKPRQLERARQWLAFECQGSGIVEELGDRRLKFWHLTFQEFLAALALAGMGDGEQQGEDWWPEVQPFLDNPQWQESIALLPGTLLDKGGRRRVDRLLERVLAMGGKTPDLPTEARIAGIMGRLLEPMSAYQYPVPQAIEESYQAILQRAFSLFTLEGAKRVPIQTRIAAAEALGQSGDLRLRGLNLIEVPGTGGWLLGKYPVTVTEFQAFVEQDGYQEQRWWCEAGWKKRIGRGWENPDDWDSQCLRPNRPVVFVSWFEAMAYCRWLSNRENRLIRLPVETLWGKAAGQGEYPWGDTEPTPELANFDENVRSSTPVGLYPVGDGPFGHCDLVGNVQEWQLNLYAESDVANRYLDPFVTGNDALALRGGSYMAPTSHLRSAYREKIQAERRLGIIGFRVCAAPSSTLED